MLHARSDYNRIQDPAVTDPTGEGQVGPALRQKRPLAADATAVATPADDLRMRSGVTAVRVRRF